MLPMLSPATPGLHPGLTLTSFHLPLVAQPDGAVQKVCYIAAHTAVVYDCGTRTQVVLQGHCNPVTCLLATQAGPGPRELSSSVR
jgi:hypothetical protein